MPDDDNDDDDDFDDKDNSDHGERFGCWKNTETLFRDSAVCNSRTNKALMVMLMLLVLIF